MESDGTVEHNAAGGLGPQLTVGLPPAWLLPQDGFLANCHPNSTLRPLPPFDVCPCRRPGYSCRKAGAKSMWSAQLGGATKVVVATSVLHWQCHGTLGQDGLWVGVMHAWEEEMPGSTFPAPGWGIACWSPSGMRGILAASGPCTCMYTHTKL